MAERMTFDEFQKEVPKCIIGINVNLRDQNTTVSFSCVAMEALYNRMAGPQELRPMKDAPRDGTPILVYLNEELSREAGNSHPIIKWWSNKWLDWESSLLGNSDECFKGWLPLPEIQK